MWDGSEFDGAKIALIHGDELIAYKRDHKAGIPHPGLWDLPGGGREGDETPTGCALREVQEEFGIVIDPRTIRWLRQYESPTRNGKVSWFLAAHVTRGQVADITFGDEGERWELMAIERFVHHPDAVPSLKSRLGDYLLSRQRPGHEA